jgi:hypothetical protein
MLTKYILDRLDEPSTWQVIIFILVITLTHYTTEFSWELAGTSAYGCSQFVKAVFPDNAKVVTEARNFWSKIWNSLKKSKVD